MRDRIKYTISAEDRTAAALRSLTGNLKGVDQQFIGLSSRLIGILGLGGGLAGAIAQIGRMTSQLDALAKTSRVFGQTAAELDGWYYAAERLGVPAQTFDQLMTRLPVVMKQAAEGSGQAAKMFSDLGVAITDQTGRFRPYTQILLDMADALEKLPTAEARAASLAGAFPEKYKDLVRVLGAGRDAIRELLVDAAMLGERTDDLTGKGEEFRDQQTRLNRALRGTGDAIWAWALPALTDFTEFLADRIPTLLTGVDSEYRRFLATLREDPQSGIATIDSEIAAAEKSIAQLRAEHERMLAVALKYPKSGGLVPAPREIEHITNRLILLRKAREELARRVEAEDYVPPEAAEAVAAVTDKYKDLARIFAALEPKADKIWREIMLLHDAYADGVISAERYNQASAVLLDQMAALDPVVRDKVQREQRAAQIMRELETETERYSRRLAEIEELHARGALSDDQRTQAAERLAAAYADVGDRGAKAMRKWGDAAETVGRGVSDAVSSAVAISTDALDGLERHAVDVINRIMAQLAEAGLVEPIAGAIRSAFDPGSSAVQDEGFIGPPTPQAGKMLAAGAGKAADVTININAIDTRSGVEFLFRNRNAVASIIRDGLHRGGNAVVVR